jgi:hypothetical protein
MMQSSKRLSGLLKASVAALGITLASASHADVISISNPNSGISGYAGPYANVTYSLVDSNTATFTVTTLGSYLIGSQGTLGLNFNGAVSLSSAISGNAGPTASCPYSLGGAGNLNGFGSFNFTIDTFDGANCASSLLTFTVDLVSGTWANTAAILTANSTGSLAAAHIFAGCTIGTNGRRTCQATGYANQTGGGPPNQVPEPQTLALLGLGLLGVAVARRKRIG